MERAVKIIVSCVCLHNFLVHDRLAHDWLESNVEDITDNTEEDNDEDGSYNFQLVQQAGGGERREQAVIDLLRLTNNI